MGHSPPYHERRSSHADGHHDAVVGSVVAAPVAELGPAIGLERAEPHTDPPVAVSPAPQPVGWTMHRPERMSEVRQREQTASVAPRVVEPVVVGVRAMVADPAGMPIPVVVDVVPARVVGMKPVPRVHAAVPQADTEAQASGSCREGESAPRVLPSRSLGSSHQHEAHDQSRSGEPLHVCLLERIPTSFPCTGRAKAGFGEHASSYAAIRRIFSPGCPPRGTVASPESGHVRIAWMSLHLLPCSKKPQRLRFTHSGA